MIEENEILKGEAKVEATTSKPSNPLTLEPFNLNPDEARLLLNIALMAIGRNRFRSAAKILAALEQFRPDHPSVAVAKAVALMSAGEFEAAVAFIDGNALGRFPGSAMLKAFKGLALIRLGRTPDAWATLAEAAASTDDPAAAKMAKDLLKD